MWRRYTGLSVIALACAAGSYLATHAFQPQGRVLPPLNLTTMADSSIAGWLGLSREQAADVLEIEATFAADRTSLEAVLQAERERLAFLFENQETPDDHILQQVEAVIAAHDALERRIARHLVALRPHLTPEQTKRLFDRFAGGVRECQGPRWRQGLPADQTAGPRGHGPPPGRGWRRGQGPPGAFDGLNSGGPSTAPATSRPGD